MIDLELSASYAGGSEPLHLFWDFESDDELVGVSVCRREKRGDAFYTHYRSADNAAWVRSAVIIQTHEHSLSVPAHWSKADQTEHNICVRLFFSNQEEYQTEIRLGD